MTQEMKAHVFREFNYAPSPVTSISSNNSVVAVFRRNQMVELVDSVTLKHFVSHRIDLTVVESKFLDQNTIICLSECKRIAIFDTVTLEKEVLDPSATHMGARFVDAACADRVFHYTTAKNELFEMRNGDSTLLHAVQGPVSTLLVSELGTLLGTSDGWVRVYKKGQCVAEVDVKAKVNQICSCENGKFVAVLENGSASLFDIENGVVFDTAEVRQHPLNVVQYVDGFVHMSGVDSRIISFSVRSGKFVKCAQADFHVSDVTCMVVDNDRVLTAGEDSVVVFNILFNSKYTTKRVYDDSVKYGGTKSFFYVTGDKSINLYRIAGQGVESMNQRPESCYNDKITFKISSGVLEKINPKQTDISHFLRFNTVQTPLALAVSFDEKYLAYSTSQETMLYNLFQGSRLGIEKIRTFGAATQILFTDDFLVVLEKSKQMVVLDLNTFKIAAEIPFDDFRERVAASQSTLVMSHMKQIIELSDFDRISTLATEDTISGINSSEGAFGFLIHRTDQLYEVGVLSDDRIAKTPLGEDVRGNVSLAAPGVLYNDRFLFVVENGRVKRYEFGHIIHGVVMFHEEPVILQTSWNYIKQKFKPGVFKPKFSN